MEITALLFRQNIIMFLYLLTGYGLYKGKFLTTQGSGELGKMLLYIIMPVAILKSYIKDFSMDMLGGLTVSFLAALGCLALSIVISALVFRKRSPIRQFGAAFSNAGFIGIPLVQMTLGEEKVFYIASFVALLNIFQWTYGVLIITGDKSSVSLGKIRSNPIVLSFLAGLLLFFLPIRVPDILMNVIGTLSSMNGPLAMIVLGTYLAQIPLSRLFNDKETYLCTVMRLLVIPALTVLCLCLMPERYGDIRMAVLLAAAAPVGSNVAIFAQLYQKDYTEAVKDICLSTLFSIFTIPVITGIADFIW